MKKSHKVTLKEKSHKVTIKDIARYTNVSTSTVSKVINNTGGVSEELERRIREAIHQFGYTPNRTARALKTRISKSIGLILPTIVNPFFPSLVRGIEDRCNSTGYSLILCNSDGETQKELMYTELLLEKQVDGIILTTVGNSIETLKRLKENDMTSVIIDRKINGYNISSVVTDNFMGARLAMEYLLELGMKRTVIISGPMFLSSSRDRLKSCEKALAERGMTFDQNLVIEGDFMYESGYTCMRKIMGKIKDFDSVFAFNDIMAIGAIEYLQEFNYRVPEDISVIGYDDIMFAGMYRPALTTVRQPAYDMGRTAFDLLMMKLSQETVGSIDVVLKPELIIRESTIKL